MFAYNELEAQSLLECFKKNGTVQVELDEKKAWVCRKLLSIMYRSLGPAGSRAKGSRKLLQFLYVLGFAPYVLLFHSGLSELVVLYSKVVPVWTYEIVDGDKHIFTFKRREWGGS